MLKALVDAVTNAIGDHGIPAVFLLMMLESACIPVPSEVIMLFAGYLVSIGKMSLLGAVVAGVLGNVVGSWIAWFVGMRGGREFVLRYGKYIHVTEKRFDLADRWFDRYDQRIVLISRCLPVIRTFISLPAGVARMPFGKFTLYTAIGCVPFVLALALLGRAVGNNWESLYHNLEYFTYLIVAVLVAVVVYGLLKLRRSDQTPGNTAA